MLIIALLSNSYLTFSQVVIFDLDKATFNTPTLPYIQSLTVTGKATFAGKPIDALQLTVKQLFSNEISGLKEAKFDQQQLTESIRSDSTNVLKLTEILTKVSSQSLDGVPELITSIGSNDLASIFTSHPPSEEDKIFENALKKSIETVNTSLKDNRVKRTEKQNEINKLEKKVTKVKFYDNVWIRKGNETDFSFSVGLLEMSEDYSFSFSVFQKNTDAFPVDKLLARLFNYVDSILVANSNYPTDNLKADVTSAISSVETVLFPGIYSLDASGKYAVKGLHLDESTTTAIIESFATYFILRKNIKESTSEAIRTENVLIDRIKATAEYRALTTAEGERILALVAEAKTDTTPLAAAVRTWADNAAIGNFYQNLYRLHAEIATNTTQAQGAHDEIMRAFEVVKTLYRQTGNVTKSGTAQTGGTTDIDGIRLGTVYGIGFVPLDNKVNYIEWFTFIGVNIRWDDFDNRLAGKKAYKSCLSRFSAMIGIAAGTQMEYRGQKLNDTRLGFKPVIGVNCEPVKHLNIGLGIISFIPQTPGNTQNDTKVRPYLSLGFDFNLFNYLIQKK